MSVTYAYDTFDRTVSNGWGTSDSGHSWLVDFGSNTNYAVTTLGGRVRRSDTYTENRLGGTEANPVARIDVEFTNPGRDRLFFGIRFRVSGRDRTAVGLNFNSNGALTYRTPGSGEYIGDRLTTWTIESIRYRMALYVGAGTSVPYLFKAWKSDDPEPDWQYEGERGSGAPSTGGFGLLTEFPETASGYSVYYNSFRHWDGVTSEDYEGVVDLSTNAGFGTQSALTLSTDTQIDPAASLNAPGAPQLRERIFLSSAIDLSYMSEMALRDSIDFSFEPGASTQGGPDFTDALTLDAEASVTTQALPPEIREAAPLDLDVAFPSESSLTLAASTDVSADADTDVQPSVGFYGDVSLSVDTFMEIGHHVASSASVDLEMAVSLTHAAALDLGFQLPLEINVDLQAYEATARGRLALGVARQSLIELAETRAQLVKAQGATRTFRRQLYADD